MSGPARCVFAVFVALASAWVLPPLPPASAQGIGGVVPIPRYAVTLGTRVVQYGDIARPAEPTMEACEKQRDVLYQNAFRQLSLLFPGERFGLTVRLRCVEGSDETIYVRGPGVRYTVTR